MNDGFRRLHPATVVIELARVLGRFIYAIAIFAFIAFSGGGGDTSELFLVGLGMVSVVVALLRYLSMRFRVANGVLEIHSGIVAKQVRTIPLASIQNIDLKQTLIHRPFQTVDLVIETASGTGAEASLSALGRQDAEELRRELRSTHSFELPDYAALDDVIWRATARDLIVIGATDNRAGAIIGGLLGLGFFAAGGIEELGRLFEGLGGLVFGGRTEPWVTFAAGAAVLLLAGWLFSMGTAYVRLYGFELVNEPRGLVRRFGLTTRLESVIVLGRLQTLAFTAGLLRRKLDMWQADASTAGSFVVKTEESAGPSTLVCPLLHAKDRARMASRLFAGLDLDALEWREVHPIAARRGFFAVFWVVVILTLIQGFAVSSWLFLLAVPGLLFALWFGSRRRRVMRFAYQQGYLAVRSGVIGRRVWVVPEAKVQYVSCEQSPFQRRAGVADLVIHTAAGGTLASALIYDLPEAEARALQDQLSLRAAMAGAWLPDAV